MKVLTKKCTGCEEEKLLKEFVKQKGGKYGKGSRCIECRTRYRETRKAFAPENHQWLLAKDNLKKGSKIK